MEKLVVIGGVAAGLSAASAAKRIKKSEINAVVFEKSGYISYGACSEPYFISGLVLKPEDLIEVTPEEFEQKRFIPIYRLHEVVDIDYNAGYVTVEDILNHNTFKEDFDYLMISTGAKGKTIDVPGKELEGIFTLRTVEDAIAIQKSAGSSKHIVICGGGYIGLEMAESFITMGKDVTILKKSSQMLLNFDPDMSSLVEEEVVSKGVKIQSGVDILSFKGNDRVEKVVTNKGEVDAETVLVSKGAAPNVDLAKEIGIRIGDTGAIAVDKRQRTNIDRVYSGGDCAEVYHIIGKKPVYIPLGPTANKAGRTAGENIGGLNTEFPGVVGTAISKIFDLEVARSGFSLKEAAEYGFDAASITIRHRSRSKHYPDGSIITVQLVLDKSNGKLLGAQMIGGEGAALRIDVIAAALHSGMTAEDLYHLDLGYAPPFAPVWDPILVAANKARKI